MYLAAMPPSRSIRSRKNALILTRQRGQMSYYIYTQMVEQKYLVETGMEGRE